MIDQGELLPWLTSTGGPLIAVPDGVRHRWRGVDLDSDLEGPHHTWGDYGRACAATDGEDAEYYVAGIDVGGAQALVLGEGKGSATFLRDRLLFVQYAPSGPESEFLASLDSRLAVLSWRRSAATWTVPGPVRLIDSASPGDTPDAHLALDIPPDTYSIDFCDSGSIFVQLTPLSAG